MSNATTGITEPTILAQEVYVLPRRRLLVFDCDGVLAPLVAHASGAILEPGMNDTLSALACTDETIVAILSGRSLAGLAQFQFGNELEIVGSYGAERRGRASSELNDSDTAILDGLRTLTEEAAVVAGSGAWVEHKPASVVLHVREADPISGTVALRRLCDASQRLHGVYVHVGKAVVELAIHRSDKGTALDTLIEEFLPASVLYLGDDEPDEAAFHAIRRRPLPGLGVRVGDTTSTAATRVLANPTAVITMLRALVELG